MDEQSNWSKESVLNYDYVLTRSSPNAFLPFALINATGTFRGDQAMEIALDVLGPHCFTTLVQPMPVDVQAQMARVAAQVLECFVADRSLMPLNLRLSLLTSFIRTRVNEAGYTGQWHNEMLIKVFDECQLPPHDRGVISSEIINGAMTEALAPLVYLVR